MKPVLLAIQKFLVANKELITRCFLSLELSMVGVTLVGAYFYWTKPEMWVVWYDLGLKFGQLALCTYLVTLVPGILTRLKFQPLVGAMITPFRRHFGITMFIAAWAHMSLTTSFPAMSQGIIPMLTTPQLVGSLAWWLLFPLWLTSNDFLQTRLGKYWKMLHRLTYLALFLIFLHVALTLNTNWAVLAGSVLVAEIFSWLIVWFRPKTPSTRPPGQPSTPLVQ